MGECGVFLDSVCKGESKNIFGRKIGKNLAYRYEKYTYTGRVCLGL
jgi:hypothetical protein